MRYLIIMIQLYFLSIVCNGLAGYFIFSENKNNIDKPAETTPTFHLVLGILCAVTGVLKILSPAEKGLFFLGDLLPAAAGIIAGLVLIFGIYRQNAAVKTGELERIGTNLLAFKKPIGIGLMCSALLHFIFGGLPLL